jgi:glycosyltransferase involved in cell wall biosynthesis
MARFRIALCITELEVGGAEKAFVELATRLDPERFEPVAYCLGPRPTEVAASLPKALESAGVMAYYLDARSARQAPSAIRRLDGLLNEQQPDLLQSFLFHANLVGRIAARRAGVPKVVSGIRVAEPRRWHRWADRLTRDLVDCNVCVSEAVARFSVKRAKLPPEKVVVIPNGIDMARYGSVVPVSPESLAIPHGRRLVTYVGRLDRQKGVGWLVETVPGWLKRLPDCNLVIVGEGPQHARIERRAKSLGISDQVRLLGWRSDVPEILAASSVVVLTSRWEGMPNVVLEAMAAGRPVLASQVEGVSELLGPATEEQTVPYGDSSAFSERLIRLLTDSDLASKLGQQNRVRAETEFPIGRTVQRYQELWESLIR